MKSLFVDQYGLEDAAQTDLEEQLSECRVALAKAMGVVI